ncbi:hypothetical protein COOONC_07396 [Cooperia oncophora]
MNPAQTYYYLLTYDEVSSEHHTPPLIGKVIEITKPLYETVLPAEPTQDDVSFSSPRRMASSEEDHRLRREPPSQHSPRPPPQEIALLPRRSIAVPAQGVTLSPQVSPPPPPQRTHVSARISPTAPHQSSLKKRSPSPLLRKVMPTSSVKAPRTTQLSTNIFTRARLPQAKLPSLVQKVQAKGSCSKCGKKVLPQTSTNQSKTSQQPKTLQQPKKQTLTNTPMSPKVPLPFAIMAGEVSVEMPEEDKYAKLSSPNDEDSDSDSDSDD